MDLTVPGIFLLLCLLAARREARSMVPAVLLLLSLTTFGFGLIAHLLERLQRLGPGSSLGGWALIVLALLTIAAVMALGVLLVINGIAVVRRESRSVTHLMSLLTGLAVLGYAALVVATALLGSGRLLALALSLLLPAAWLGFGLIAYLLWAWLYGWWARHHGGPVVAVVMLGAGIRSDGAVPPLLAHRIDAGLAWARRSTPPPALVMSGGRGPDEPVAEAEAMATYAVDHHAVVGPLLLEDRSTSTDENLMYTREVLDRHDIHGPVAVVTNNFHAFRAAMLMRRAGLDGYSIGAPTASYYWPTAVLREYVAILDLNRRLTVVSLTLLSIPAVALLLLLLV